MVVLVFIFEGFSRLEWPEKEVGGGGDKEGGERNFFRFLFCVCVNVCEGDEG